MPSSIIRIKAKNNQNQEGNLEFRFQDILRDGRVHHEVATVFTQANQIPVAVKPSELANGSYSLTLEGFQETKKWVPNTPTDDGNWNPSEGPAEIEETSYAYKSYQGRFAVSIDAENKAVTIVPQTGVSNLADFLNITKRQLTSNPETYTLDVNRDGVADIYDFVHQTGITLHSKPN